MCETDVFLADQSLDANSKSQHACENIDKHSLVCASVAHFDFRMFAGQTLALDRLSADDLVTRHYLTRVVPRQNIEGSAMATVGVHNVYAFPVAPGYYLR